MFSSRRLGALAFGLFLSTPLVRAQVPESVDSPTNWTAPPFWTPPKAAAVELWKQQGLLPEGAEAVEGLPAGPLPFYAIPPCRIVDTRGGGVFTGAYGPPAMVANASRDFDLNSAPHCPGIPAGAEAYSINVTVTQTTGLGDVRIWPAGSPPAVPVSTQNWPAAGLSLANAAIAPAGTGGSITVYVAGSSTHLIIDINGYYAPISIVNTLNGLSGAVTLAAGANVSITPSGNTLTIAATGGGSDWSLTGNSGTTPGTNFLGTTDNQRLEIKVNGQRVFRLEPTGDAPNVIGGSSLNTVTTGVTAGTIGGGGGVGMANAVTDLGGTVGGGLMNRAGDNAGTTIDAAYATVSGGQNNVASGQFSFIGGGYGNLASGYTSMIPGGNQNRATGFYSFAAGQFAQSQHDGAWVWGDNTFATITSTGVNQFIVRASGGIFLGSGSAAVSFPAGRYLNTYTGGYLTTTGIWTNNSDVTTKENFEPVDRQELLARLVQLPMSTWSYKADKGAIRHIGPMAQDFAATFGVGNDNRSIGTIDADGVALAAIQALYEEVQELRKRVAELEAEKD
jgi:endosialidase-like protein